MKPVSLIKTIIPSPATAGFIVALGLMSVWIPFLLVRLVLAIVRH